MTKLGTAIPRVARTLRILSTAVPRLYAATTPSGMPSRSDTSTAIPPTFADTGNFVEMILMTVRPLCFRLRPKSPWHASVRYVT